MPMFVSHYACSDAEDANDTNIQALPTIFRRPDGCHHSIRIRFRNSEGAEQRIIDAIPAECWYSEFMSFDPIVGLADDRFCDHTAGDLSSRRRRARIVADVLFSWTRLYLDSLRPCAHGIGLETSHCVHNGVLHTPYQSLLHMILNPPFFADRVVGLVPSAQGQAVTTIARDGMAVGISRRLEPRRALTRHTDCCEPLHARAIER